MEPQRVKGQPRETNPAGLALILTAALAIGLFRAKTEGPAHLYELLMQIMTALPQHPAWLVGLTVLLVIILSTVMHDLHGWVGNLNPLHYGWKARIWYATRREEKWLVVFRNRVIAILDVPHQEDLFWTSYRIRPITRDRGLIQQMQRREFWNHCERRGISFVTHPHRIPAPFAFPAVNAVLPSHRLRLRGLELPFSPYPWDYPFILAVRLLGVHAPRPASTGVVGRRIRSGRSRSQNSF